MLNTLDVPLGRVSESPLPESMLIETFKDWRVLTAEQADRTYSILRALEALPDVRVLPRSAVPQ